MLIAQASLGGRGIVSLFDGGPPFEMSGRAVWWDFRLAPRGGMADKMVAERGDRSVKRWGYDFISIMAEELSL
jgi:hypothetical protein